MPNRWGSSEPGSGEPANTRNQQIVVVVNDPGSVKVSTSLLDEFELGFDRPTADAANLAFSQTLYALAEVVADRQPDQQLDPDDPADRQLLEESLRLDADEALDHLDDLAEIGRGLRGKLDDSLVNELKGYGFLQGDEANEPALTFLETVPIQWEMMYEGGLLDDTDSQNFWGFRTPITHWSGRSRLEEIRLQYGFFSAINDDLEFAGREVSILARQLESRLSHDSLENVFRERITSSLRDDLHKNEIEIEDWWQDSKDQWLSHWLQTVASTEKARSKAKLRLLVGALRDSFHHNLLHFACHCEPSTMTEFLTKLDMKVAGESIELLAGYLSSPDLKRDFQPTDPGPLVFLNACSTGAHSLLNEAPGFPKPWIISQGALAVVSTLCPVPDYFAHAFALKFYEYLFEFLTKPGDAQADRRRSLREALLDTRRFFMQEYNNPLGLAYVLYAFQNVHMLADFIGEGEVS